MKNISKYNFILDLEKKYSAYFEMSKNIVLLPPILKKIGLIFYLAFPVVDYPNENENIRPIKRPIGVILVNKSTTIKEQIYDMKYYEFTQLQNNFDYAYYDLIASPDYWPNKTLKNEEKLKIALDILGKVINENNIFKKNELDYENYLNRIKQMFPPEYFLFYEELKKNKIELINDETEKKRTIEKIKQEKVNQNFKKQNIVKEKDLKKEFLKFIKMSISDFVKFEILPSLRGKTSYFKLIFYNELGKLFKNFDNKIENKEEEIYNCFNPELNINKININKQSILEQKKIEIIKIMSTCQKTKVYEINIVDSISKILVVFLNSLLIEEIHNTVINTFEEEIKECISIFNENIENVHNNDVKEFLKQVFNGLCNDYKISDKENLSDTYYGYFTIHYPFN